MVKPGADPGEGALGTEASHLNYTNGCIQSLDWISGGLDYWTQVFSLIYQVFGQFV